MGKHKVFHLTARQDFGPYKKGDHIEDHAEVERITNGEHRVHVIRVAADAEPEEKVFAGEKLPPPLPEPEKAAVKA